jgi:hypothetical protein
MKRIITTLYLTRRILRLHQSHASPRIRTTCAPQTLQAAADAPRDKVRGLVLLNTAGAMNNKGVVGDWRILAVYPLLLFIDFLLSIPTVRGVASACRMALEYERSMKGL